MLTQILLQLVVVVSAMVLCGIFAIVGRYRLRGTFDEWPQRLRSALPIGSILLAILLLNRHYRHDAPELEQQIGLYATGQIFAIEGYFILVFQHIASDEANAFFSFMYVYGYTFLLVFPVLAYFALRNTLPLRELLTAYTINYAIGLVFYMLFIAYGPRNVFPDLVQTTLLYDSYPTTQHLTREVNNPTNVFPSLHTSLATTVAIFAYLTRDIYPRWFPIAVFIAGSVTVSTMYLAIHWAIDVVAGFALAGVSVGIARLIVGQGDVIPRLRALRPDRKKDS